MSSRPVSSSPSPSGETSPGPVESAVAALKPHLRGWIHAVARYNPATAALEAARGLIAGSPVKLVLAFGLLAGGIALMSVFARRGLASAERAG